MSDSAAAENVVWVELRLLVPETDPLLLESLDSACLEVAPGGFVVEGADVPPGDEPPPPIGWSRYRVYVGEAELEQAKLILETALGRWGGAELSTAPLPEGWRDRWKEWFLPVEITPDLVVTPPWHAERVRAEGGPERRLIVIEPGMAFGTGQHETTFVCLEGIEALGRLGALPQDVLDVGCGTGVLAVGAALAGATHVHGVDNDPVAVRAARVNARDNGVAEHVTFGDTPIAEVDGVYGLVVANIMTHILLAMRDDLIARVAPGGILMLSGILREQEDEIVEAFAVEGLVHVGTIARGGWIRVDLVRAALGYE
ncbi:MAG: methyltransferase domain-containing protein [Deltaproteobacteria bacterium]|nr:MAG: methyltransferase domain-containing protein [Deltaproteobacteria bacterium]